MTPISQDSATSISAPASRRFGAPAIGGLSPAQLESWRIRVNECEHPMLILDSQFKPILRNAALRQRLSEPATAAGTSQPTAFLWQTICDTAEHLAAQAARTGLSQITEVFPVNQRCIVAVGSLLKSHNGTVVGAVINFADISNALHNLPTHTETATAGNAAPTASDEEREEFRNWTEQRELAQQKMARLSRRESQVVALVADGYPNKKIARELEISVKTIEKHRANAFRKLGVASTPEMVRIAVIAGNKTATPEPRPESSGHISHPPQTF